MLNSIALGLFDYTDRASKNTWNRALDKANMVFSIIYIAEATLKIIAFGLVRHQKAYLRETWNIIDFIVVLSR